MLAYEHYHTQQFPQPSYTSEANSVESYSTHIMESFDFNTSTYTHIPMSYCDTSVTYAEAPFDGGYQMTRSFSSDSARLSAHDRPPTLLSSASGASGASSPVGSPYSEPVRTVSCRDIHTTQPYLNTPTILNEHYQGEYTNHLNADLCFAEPDKVPATSFVDIDPVLITSREPFYFSNQYSSSTVAVHQTHSVSAYSPAPSPAPSHQSTFGQVVTPADYSQPRQRRTSVSSQRSGNSSRASVTSDEGDGEKGRCPHPECGRSFKDLKAHKLTHLSERPFRCPIPNCDYYTKGFARKYDKNRHTLTHYKGTMICGFCPGSGSAAEKSFNRADVFKRHLTQIHGVEQNPPNSRKRSPSASNKKLASYCPDATGKCSTCSSTFTNAQEFYEHLDDCVLRVVQREDPMEAINALRLAEVDMDTDVLETLERHHIKKEETEFNPLEDEEEEDDDDDDDMDDDDDEDGMSNDKFGRTIMRTARAAGARVIIGGGITKNTKSGKKGMTWSKGGVALVGKGRKRRKHYPASWGLPADKMKMKKRVILAYNGPHRLFKDDMMLHSEHEVRMRLPDSDYYVTDLDVESLKRTEAFHGATEEEKAEWIPQQDFLNDLMA